MILGGVALTVGVAAIFLLAGKSDEEYLKECEKALDGKNWERLQQVASDWKSQSADSGNAMTFLADAKLHLGMPEEAVEELLRIPKGSRQRYRGLIAAAEIQFGQLNRPLEGIDTLERITEIRPTSSTAHQRIIFFYGVTLQRAKMLEAINKAIDSRAEPPDAYVYLLLAGKLSFSNGFEKNSEWLAGNPDNEIFEVARMIQLIDSVTLSENPTTQKSLPAYWDAFDQLRKKYPDNLALASFEAEKAAKDFALDRMDKILTSIPEEKYDGVLLKWRGWLALQRGNLKAALEMLEKSLDDSRLDWRVWHDLSRCRRRLGDLDGAEQAEQIALVGKQLHKDVLQLPNAGAIQSETLKTLASYAASCGDDRVALAIMLRLQQGQSPG